MLVNKITKGFQTRSDMPNYNWLGEDWYLIPDNSELANKVKDLYPRFDLVVENGVVTDVLEIARSEEEILNEQIEDIKQKLKVLDQTVDRQWEDYYKDTNKEPVERISIAISTKEKLRAEMNNLKNRILNLESEVL